MEAIIWVRLAFPTSSYIWIIFPSDLTLTYVQNNWRLHLPVTSGREGEIAGKLLIGNVSWGSSDGSGLSNTKAAGDLVVPVFTSNMLLISIILRIMITTTTRIMMIKPRIWLICIVVNTRRTLVYWTILMDNAYISWSSDKVSTLDSPWEYNKSLLV